MRCLLVLALLGAPAATATAQDTPRACPDAPSTIPSLTNYSELVPGARYRVVVRWDARSRSWLPHPALAMPLHHASTIEHAEGVALPRDGGPDLELTVVALERRLVDYRDREHTWFFTYRVRVESICIPRP